MNKISLTEALARNGRGRTVNPATVRKLATDFFETTLEHIFPEEIQNDHTRKCFLDIFDTENKDISMTDALKNSRQIALRTGRLDDLFLMAVLGYIPEPKHHRLFDCNLFDYLELSPDADAYKLWFQNDYFTYRKKHGHFPSVYNALANMCVQVSENSINPKGLIFGFLCNPPAGTFSASEIDRPFCRSGNDPYETFLMANRVYILMTQIPYDLTFDLV